MKFKFFSNIFLKWFLIVGFFVVLFFLIFNYYNNNDFKNSSPQVVSLLENTETNNIKYVKIGDIKLKVDLALTSQEKEQGLSGRNGLKEDEGMLFIFNHMDEYPFWMKDMNFDIDIIWIDDNFNVVYIEKNAKPESYPDTFEPRLDSMYVLEVNNGFSEKNNLKVGERVEFLSS